MFKVIVRTPDGRETFSYRDKPSAVHAAVNQLASLGANYANVSIESGEGAVVFAHSDILRTFEMVRL